MAESVELAAGYVSIIPSFDGIEGNLANLLGGGEVGKAADKAGSDAGNNFAGKFSDSAKAGLAVAGVALGAAVIGSFNTAIDNEAASNKLTAQLALSPEESARYGKLAGELYANNYGGSMSEVNDALKSVTTEIGGMRDASDEELSGITAKVLSVSSAFDQDMGGTARAVGQMMKTGMAPDAESALDLIATGFQKIPGSADDLLDTFNEYSVHFQSLGLEGPQALGFIQSAMEGGARDTDIAADALKEFSLRASDVGDSGAQEAFESLGLSGEEMAAKFAAGGTAANDAMVQTLSAISSLEDPAAQKAAAVGLLGTQAEDLAGALLAVDPTDLVSGLGDLNGAAAQVDETMGSGAGASLSSFKRELEALGSGAIASVLPILTPLLGFLTQFAPILGPLALGIGLVTAAQWLWNAAQLANPMTWIILGIVAVIAGIVLLVTHWDQAVAFLLTLWEPIGAFFTNMWDGIVFGAQIAWEWLKSLIAGIWDGIMFIFMNFSLPGLLLQHWDEIAAFTSTIWNGILDFMSGFWSFLSDTFMLGVDTIAGFVEGLYNNVTGWFGDLVGMASSWGTDIMSGLLSGLNSMKSSILEFFGGLLPEWIKGPVMKALGIHSPSRVFAELGVNTAEGFLVGTNSQEDVIKRSMEGMVAIPNTPRGSIDPANVGTGSVTNISKTWEVHPSEGMDELELANKVARTEELKSRG